MKSPRKKFLSIMLTVCMLAALMPAMTLTASAVSGNYGAFTVEGDDLSGVSYDTHTRVLTISDNAPYTIRQTAGVESYTTGSILIDSASGASITLNSVYIWSALPFKITEDTGPVDLTLADGSDNMLISNTHNAGLQKESIREGSMLTIGSGDAGTGKLYARGGFFSDGHSYGAGIGGCGGGSTAYITITGGNVTAVSGNDLTFSNGVAGIGGGTGGKGSNITITGGMVTAKCGNGGYGIGGPYAENIVITGGNVKTDVWQGTAIGPPPTNGTEDVELYTLTVCSPELANTAIEALVTNLDYEYGLRDVKTDDESKLYFYLPNGVTEVSVTAAGMRFSGKIGDGNTATLLPEPFGDFMVTGAVLSGLHYDAGDGVLTISGAGPYTISQTEGVDTSTTDRIKVDSTSGASITLDGVDIDVSGTSGAPAFRITGNTGPVDLTSADGSVNTLKSGVGCAGLQKDSAGGDSMLTIGGIGTLNATGGDGGAGIGGGEGCAGSHITIEDGTVNSTGGVGGAGIGGGEGCAGSYITIEDGTVNARGGSYAAGIGGGSNGVGENITIEDGTVNATGGIGGAGIGGGQNKEADVVISGGRVTAGSTDGATTSGAAIGAGANGVPGNVAISGGTVTAAGIIGGGMNKSEGNTDPGSVTISGGMVTSTEGIGSHEDGAITNIIITGGSVKAGMGSTPTNGADTQLELYTLTVGSPNSLPNSAVDGLSVTPELGYTYGLKDVRTDADGKLYVYLPAGKTTATIPVGWDTYAGNITENAATLNMVAHSHKVCGAAADADCDHAGTTHSAITYDNRLTGGISEITESGNYFLGGDLSMQSSDIFGQITVNLCLNGYEFESRSGTNLGGNVTLNICDCTGRGKIVNMITTKDGDETVNLYSGTVETYFSDSINNKGKVNVYGGTIEARRNGISNNGTVNVYGGAISARENGILNNETGTVDMYGGTVSGSYDGINNSGTVNLSGGTITSDGKAVKVESGTLNLSGDPVLTGTEADIYLASGRAITVTGELTSASDTYSVNTEYMPANAGLIIAQGTATYPITAGDMGRLTSKDGHGFVLDGNAIKLYPAYTITLNANGGTGGTNSVKVTYGQAFPTFPKHTRAGYALAGYYTGASGGTKVIEANGMLVDTVTGYTTNGKWTRTDGATLYAQWTDIPATPPAISAVTGAALTYGYSSGSISVSATAATGHSITGYQWYSNTTESNTSGTAISGATGSTYNIPTGYNVGNYYYYCVVTATRTDNNQTASTTSNVATVTVDAAAVTFTGESATRTYTGSDIELTGMTASGLLDGHDYTGLTYSAKGKNVGTYAGTFTGTVVIKDTDGTDVTENYAVTQTHGSLTITNAEFAVTFTGESATRTYTGSDIELTGMTASGLLDGHDYTGLTYSAKGKNVGEYSGVFTGTVVIKDAEDTDVTENYAVTQTPGRLTISTKTPVAADFTYTSPTSLGYDGTAKAVTVVTAAGISGMGNVTVKYYKNDVETAPKDVGTYAVKIDVAEGTNYASATGLTDSTWTFAVTAKQLTATHAGISKVYDGTTTASIEDVELQGVLPGDTVTGSAMAQYADNNVGTDKNITFTYSISGEDSGNYLAPMVQTLGIGVITPRPIRGSWTELTKDYTGDPQVPTFGFESADIIPADSVNSGVSVVSSDNSRTNVGSYLVTATLDGARAGNYMLTNPTAYFIIQKAPVTFGVSDNAKSHTGNALAATVTATAIGADFTAFTVSYRDSAGAAVTDPTDVGTYDIYAEITNTNYRHAGAADGGAQKIGVFTIHSGTAPATYTVAFDGNGATIGTTDGLTAAQAGTPRLLPANGFTPPTDKTFIGWEYDGSVYQPGESIDQPAANITLTAQWAENVYDISGGVTNAVDEPLANVMVTLMLGSEQVGQPVITGADGNYSFTGVLPGQYNLVANWGGIIQTILVELGSEHATGKDITMPAGKTNSVVEVAAGSPAIVVGNLENSFTAADEAEAIAGKTVEIKLRASATSTTQTDIETAATGDVGLYLNVTLTRTVNNGTPVTLTASPVLLKLIINLPGELQGKESYTVCRLHGNPAQVQTLTTSPSADGEYITVNADKTVITVYAKYFSLYAIAYTEATQGGSSSSGAPDSYKPTVPDPTNGSVTTNPAKPPAGATVTTTVEPDEGYELDKLIITDKNGKEIPVTDKGNGQFTFVQPVGPVTITATFKPIGEPPVEGPSFRDAAETDWFYEDVKYVCEAGLMEGTAAGEFSPYMDTTRAMIVTVLWRMESKPAATGDNPFEDVAAGLWYTDAVIWAAEKGIVGGYGDGRFGPRDVITREQLATILYRYAMFKGYDVSGAADLSAFADADKISPWALPALQWACGAGLMQGDNENLMPKKSAQRCQVAAILHRFSENVK